jgi:hypothetical protein
MKYHRIRFGSMALLMVSAFAQDTRHVTEPKIPPDCVTLTAKLAAPGGALAEADEDKLDSSRIQQALDGCVPGRAVVPKASGSANAFLSGPLQLNFDALVIGYYDSDKLIYAARTRNGFTPASRAVLFKKLKPLETKECPFANLPEEKAGRWGAGLTAAKMPECRWLLCRMRHSSHNVECRTMPYAFWGGRFWNRLRAVARVWP